MSRRCDLTGATKMYGNQVSHSNRKTRIYRELNLRTKRYFVTKFSERVTLRLTSRAIKTIDKCGTLEEFLKRTPNIKLTAKLLDLKKRILK